MEITREKIIEVLYESIEELNEQRSNDQKLPASVQTALLGGGAGLDSLGFVNLVALVEEKCQERFGRSLVLTEGTGKEGARDPFETVGTLAEYIEVVLTSGRGDWR